jgi:hypothetical protein
MARSVHTPAAAAASWDSPLGSALTLAQSLTGTLRMARALAQSGRRIDVAGIAEPIGLLCAKSLDLPPEQGREMRGVLMALRQEVDLLAESLRDAAD